MLTLTLAVALITSGSPPSKKPPAVQTAIKEGLSAEASVADGGAYVVNGLDLSKMPFTPDSIKQVVMTYQPQIQGCYEETLAVKDDAPEGTLKTSFIITGEGFVKSAKIDKRGSSLKDSKLHDCVVAILSSMVFPKPPDEKDHPIDFPFNLKAIH